MCEQKAIQDGIAYFFISSGTKDYEAIQKFYKNCGYDIWTTLFYKRIGRTSINYPAGELDNIRYVSIYAKYKGKWVFCFHKQRQKWECPGGCILPGIMMLNWGKNMDCTWAGALYAALKYLGEDITYEQIMGLSGACYRLSFVDVWDWSAVDALVAYDYSDILFKAIGYEQICADRINLRELYLNLFIMI